MGFLCIACMEKGKSEDMSVLHPSKLFYTFPFPKKLMKRSNTLSTCLFTRLEEFVQCILYNV